MHHRHLGSRRLLGLSRSHFIRRTSLRDLQHLQDCLWCQRNLGPLAPKKPRRAAGIGRSRHQPGGGPLSSAPYRQALGRAFQAAAASARWLEQGRAEAQAHLAALLAQPRERRPLLVRNRKRHHSWGLAELLLGESRHLLPGRPEEAADLVALAFEVLDQLDTESPGGVTPPFGRDLRARAWAYRAGILRHQGELEGAAAAFAQAEWSLESGSGDPLEKAEISRLRAGLLADQGRTAEAELTLRLALWTYARTGEEERAAAVAVDLAGLLRAAGKAAQAVGVLAQVLGWIDAEGPAELRLALLCQLAAAGQDAGRPELAWQLLPRARRLFRQHGDRRARLQLLWLEGRIAVAMGFHARAEQCFRRARTAFRETGAEEEGVRVGLDLADLYLRLARPAEALQLAAELTALYPNASSTLGEAITQVATQAARARDGTDAVP